MLVLAVSGLLVTALLVTVVRVSVPVNLTFQPSGAVQNENQAGDS